MNNNELKRLEMQKKKKKLDLVCEEHPELRTALNVREKVGRPRIEDDQPMLLKSIVDIAMYGSASHEKRKSSIEQSKHWMS